MGPPRRLLFLLLLLLLPAALAASGDSAAMSDLARSLSGAPPNWKPGSDPCAWSGVTCQSGAVTEIRLSSGSISGTLPASLSSLSSLRALFLPRNRLSGPLPSLSGLPNLQSISLDGNAFTSLPPSFFSSLPALQDVSLDDNPLSPWSIPDDLSSSTSLSSFSASNSSITGSIPSFFGDLPQLQTLRLSYNNLSGEIPPSFANSTSLKSLMLNNQQSPDKLSGNLDPISSMVSLVLLWIQSNSFSGPIPDVSNLIGLESFNLRDNVLTGVVPDSLIRMASLKNVSLSNNYLQGPMPEFGASVVVDVDKGNNFCNSAPGPCDPRVTALLAVAGGFGYPARLAGSWHGNDPCSNWDGVTCDPQGQNVVTLNLANRQLVGRIDPGIANLTSVTRIFLNNNNLTGSIPDAVTGMRQLQVLDVSNNQLSGKIPSFGENVKFTYSGNPLLGTDEGSGGDYYGSGGSGGSGTPGSSSAGGQFGGGSKSSAGFVVGIVLAVVVLVGCTASLVYYLHRKKQNSKFGWVQTQSPPNEPEVSKIAMSSVTASSTAVSGLYSQGSGDTISTIAIDDLRRATNNFSEDNVLGQGGFGVVYKGHLNGTIVAVKRNETGMMGKKGMEEFYAEIHVLQKVRHRNLVAFLGYCKDDGESLLVYEFMPEGTLGQHLFERNGSKYCALTWKQRLSVALDVARGIEYLHSFAQDSFIHRDLKPSNILLDNSLRAKVSDFGLVKLADKEKSMHTRLAGTFGYLAPEYALTGKVTTKVDVYAFGVILMELITGRKALDESETDELNRHLVTAFRRYVIDEEKFMNFVDSSLDLDPEARFDISKMAELACHCTAREPHQRPNMSHAVNVLSSLVDKWEPDTAARQEDDDEDDSAYDIRHRLQKWQSDNDSFSTSTFNTYMGSPSTRNF